MEERTFMHEKLLAIKGYTPYCGAQCRTMPRTRFDGQQFVCPCCGWRSKYSSEFIEEYKKKWKIS